MDEYPSPLDGVFHALSDPTRRAMLAALLGGERSVGALAAPFEISLAAASKHIRALERAGLLERTVRGRTHLCALRAAPLAQAVAWLDSYVEGRHILLDAGAAAAAPSPPERS
ncbi:ArsR/SmtB family transcription factor [Luteimonas saliphila]|uniref:ArsR/SmtB family transcription factor n=1 Tax=Luteimonas saliphila TaxID=2804919 RepID=UPI00192D979D|nr:metalloregulator ArsR/SmtB family transcription factor [Luteimonas saliphila]